MQVKCENFLAEEHLHMLAELTAGKAKPDIKCIITPTKKFATKPEA